MTPVRGEGLDPAARIESSTRGFPLCPRAQAGPPPLHHARRKGALSSGHPAGTRPGWGRPRGAHPVEKKRAVVGPGAGRTPPDLRGRLAPHVYRLALSLPDRAHASTHSRDLGGPSISSPGSTTRRSTSATSMHCSPSSARARNGPGRAGDRHPVIDRRPRFRPRTPGPIGGSRGRVTPLLCPRQRHPATSGIFHTFLVNYVTVTGARSR